MPVSRERLPKAFVLLAALLAIALPALPPEPLRAQDTPTAVPALLARFRTVRGLSARFREVKRIALLEEPLVSEGMLYFVPPSRLARVVERPSTSSMVLDGDELRLADSRHTERIDLNRVPVVRAFVDAFRSVLAGDDAALARSFRTRLRNDADGTWILGLSPRLPAVARAIRWIEVAGRDVRIAGLRIIEVSGDDARTTFSEVNTTRAFAPAEVQRLFGAHALSQGTRSR